MAEIVGSAVVNEAVSTLSSFLSGKHKERETAEEKVERLEMAVLKIRTAVDMSEGWRITHQPLLLWKAKLKHVAEEGDDIVRAHKQQILERIPNDENTASCSSFPERIARAAKGFLSFRRRDGELSNGTVRRFERLADSASDFFKFAESSGRPMRFMFFQPLNRFLLAGKSVECSLRTGGGAALILFSPWLEDRQQGLQACVFIVYEDDRLWEKNFKMSMVFRLLETVDPMRIAMKCLELLPPQFGSSCAALTEIFSQIKVPDMDYINPSMMLVWYNQYIEKCRRDWLKPYRHHTYSSTGIQLPEPVLKMGVQCYILPLNNNSAGNDKPPLELGCAISPNFNLEKYCGQYVEVGPHELDEYLPKVTDGFYHDAQTSEHTRHRWCSHSSTYLLMEPVLSRPLTVRQLYWMENSSVCRSASRPRARRSSGRKMGTMHPRYNLRIRS